MFNMDVLLVINPISGSKNKSDFIEFAKRSMKEAKMTFHVFQTTGENDCRQLEDLISESSPGKVIIAGGDGTLNMFLKPLMDSQVNVGFIPMGSANGMAEELDLEDNPKVLFQKFLKSNSQKTLDLISINKSYLCLHLADIGANANLVANYEKDGGRGMFTYAKHFWTEFRNLKPFEFEIKTEQMEYERKGVMLAICNGRKYGTGIPLNTIGKMDDGFFEFVVVKAMDFTDLIKAALSKFDENQQNQNLETIQAKSATIKLKSPRLLQIDGEVIEKFEELQIKIIPKALKFMI
jgi:YegS/Rv2252/BmrU family lipid kinase